MKKKQPTQDELDAKEMIDALRKELGNKLADMKGRPLEGVTKEQFAEQLKLALLEVWQEGKLEFALPEKPMIEFDFSQFKKTGWVHARPLNETATRIMQMMNMTEPTHRVKGVSNEK